MFNITETPGTSIYVTNDTDNTIKLVQVALGQSGTDLPTQSGNNGKVLGTDGADLSWVDPSGLPEQSGNAGKVLGTDGNNTSWVAQTGGGSSLPDTSGHSNEILSNDGADLDWRGIDRFLPDQSGHSNEVLITVGGVLSWVPIDALPEQSGKNGYYLTTDGADPYWAPIDALPSQSGNSGKVLSTNGSATSWESIPTELPAQSGNSGKKLTTDGSNPSWTTDNLDSLSDVTITTPASTQILSYNGSSWVNGAAPSSLPAQSGNSGKVLTTNGSTPSWEIVPTELPAQSGNSGKVLTTNGSTPAWEAAASGLPSQSGNSGKYLTTNGSTSSWDIPTPWAAYTATDSALPVGGMLTVTHPVDTTLKRIVQGLVMSTPSTPSNWWRFEETSGTTLTPSAGAVNMTSINAVLAQAGKFGYCPSFSGSAQYLTASKSVTAHMALTVDMWIYPTSVTGTHNIWGIAPSAVSTSFFVALRSVGTTLTYYFGGGWNLNGGTISLNTWTHLTFTWDGTTVKSYQDSAIVHTYNSAGTNQSTATLLIVGEAGNVFYAGRVDNLMIFDNYAMPIEAITLTETYSYGGAWQPMQLGTADGQISVSYASDTTTTFTSHLLDTQQVKVEVLL
jgi:hypothetical protein